MFFRHCCVLVFVHPSIPPSVVTKIYGQYPENYATSNWIDQVFKQPGQNSIAPFQYPIWCVIVRSREVLNPWNLCLELFDSSEILQAPQQHCCQSACQISEWCNNSNYQSCLWLCNIMRFYDKISYTILKQGPGCLLEFTLRYRLKYRVMPYGIMELGHDWRR